MLPAAGFCSSAGNASALFQASAQYWSSPSLTPSRVLSEINPDWTVETKSFIAEASAAGPECRTSCPWLGAEEDGPPEAGTSLVRGEAFWIWLLSGGAVGFFGTVVLAAVGACGVTSVCVGCCGPGNG